MSDPLFDRYREALRAGHVAVLRGRLEDAQAAYRTAAALAGDRAVPRSALGSVELRLGLPEQALASFDTALALAPADDAALVGRAQALVVLERPDEAAATYDLLADARRAAGKRPDAGDALRRALEIQPTPVRRQRYRDLADELREGVGDAEAERALARALRFLETEPAGSSSGPPPDDPASGGEPAEPGAPAAPPAESDLVAAGDAHLRAAEEAAAGGDRPGVVAAAIAAARAYQAARHPIAALDACDRGLEAGPDDVGLHLLIAELSLGRGAVGPAGETYRTLLRLVEIDADPAARERVLGAARAAFPGDPRFPSA